MKLSDFYSILDKLNELELSPQITRVAEFYDEPKFLNYQCVFKIGRRHKKKLIVGSAFFSGLGFSINSPKDALFKSLFEAMERFCLDAYSQDSIRYGRFSDNPRFFVNPTIFTKRPELIDRKFGWVGAVNLMTGKKCYIPAQLIFLHFLRNNKGEPLLDFPSISTGGAIGRSREQALLNGIYEVIERDSFMTIYLNKITPPKVDLEALGNKAVKLVLEKCARYKLELYVLDITCDLGIPVYCAVLIDRSGFGPAVSAGAKAGFSQIDAVLGAIGESFMVRNFVKRMLKNGSILVGDNLKGTDVFSERAAYWIYPKTLKYIQFLLSSSKSHHMPKSFGGQSKKAELDLAISILKSHSLDLYAVDITPGIFKQLGFWAYKVVMPQLQPLYLREVEKGRVINPKRLREIADFFGKKYEGPNPIPHPFL